jgi:hypothetical protein
VNVVTKTRPVAKRKIGRQFSRKSRQDELRASQQERRQKNQEHDIRFQPDFGQSRKEAENKASEYQDYRVGNIERPGRSNQNHQHDEQAND